MQGCHCNVWDRGHRLLGELPGHPPQPPDTWYVRRRGRPSAAGWANQSAESNFNIPVYREILMFQGISSVSRRSCHNILSKGAGSAIAIVVGGAAESLSAHPGTHDLTLKRRFGFIKVAIREGANLVPVFSFGENDVSSVGRECG